MSKGIIIIIFYAGFTGETDDYEKEISQFIQPAENRRYHIEKSYHFSSHDLSYADGRRLSDT